MDADIRNAERRAAADPSDREAAVRAALAAVRAGASVVVLSIRPLVTGPRGRRTWSGPKQRWFRVPRVYLIPAWKLSSPARARVSDLTPAERRMLLAEALKHLGLDKQTADPVWDKREDAFLLRGRPVLMHRPYDGSSRIVRDTPEVGDVEVNYVAGSVRPGG